MIGAAVAHRVINAFSVDDRNFGGKNKPLTWSIESGNGSDSIRLVGVSLYPTYIPNEPSIFQYSLLTQSAGTSDIVISSPYIEVVSLNKYLSSLAVYSIYGDLEFALDMKFYSSATSTTEIAHSTTVYPIDVVQSKGNFLLNEFIAPAGANFAKLFVTISGANDTSLSEGDAFSLYDPVVCYTGIDAIADFSLSVYNSLPNFMLLDDENINDILSKSSGASERPVQLSQPLRRFVETLSTVVDHVYEEYLEFRYDRAADGVEHLSKLTDPVSADPRYLAWLASVTGTTLLVNVSGFSPWAAIEEYDSDDSYTPPEEDLSGQWNDLESLDDWLSVQDVNPDFFDITQSFRDQLSTGYSGIDAGRPDTIEAFLRTLLQTETFATDVVVVRNEHRDNPFNVEVLIDPSADPDPGGTFVLDALNNGLSAGASGSVTNAVLDSGRGSYDFSTLLSPLTENDSSACGAVIYGKPFISDKDNFARHIVLNETSASATIPDIGGGIGDSHYYKDSSYFYGDVSSSVRGSVVTDDYSLTDLTLSSEGYDIIVVISDVTRPTAGVYSGTSSGTPDPYLFREKRLIVSGSDSSGGGNNDWALYMVSGATPSVDNFSRLLFIDGYMDSSATNYAYSDPIDGSLFTQSSTMCIRFSKDASDNYTFYVQNSLYDDWEQNAIGSGSFSPTSSFADGYANIKVLGELNNSLWSDAGPLSCSVRRVLIYNPSLVFDGSTATSSLVHSIVDGENVSDFGTYSYTPTIDIDFTSVDKFATSFNASTSVNGFSSILGVTVNTASTNDIDVLVMRPHVSYGNLWHFGKTYGSGNGDTLVLSGLPSGNYEWTVFKINTSDGTIDSTATGSETGVTSITFDADTYGGDTILSVEVVAAGDSFGSGTSAGASAVAFFEADTITSDSTSAADSVTPSLTWTLTRTWPLGGAYSPSQTIDKPYMHLYESAPYVNNSPVLEHWSEFSIVLQVRRFWTGTEGTDSFDILSIQNEEGEGLFVYYDGPKIKVDFFDGSVYDSVEWVESPTYGDWHWLVIRRNANGLELVVDGDVDNAISDTVSVLQPLTSSTSRMVLGESGWSPRAGVATLAFYTRYLEDNEIALLEAEIS